MLWVLALAFGASPGTDQLWLYCACFALGGVAGSVGLVAMLRLPDPGRVRARSVSASAPAPGMTAAAGSSPNAAFRNLSVASTIAAAGGGFMPALALVAVGPLGLAASFTVLLAAIASTVSLGASVVAASLIAGLSASRLLRATHLARVGEISLVGLALAVPAAAPALLVLAAVLEASTSAVNGTASSELVYRVSGADIVRTQGRYTAATHGAYTVTSLLASSLLATGAGTAFFVVLLGASGALRLTGAAILRVSPSWREAPAVGTGDAAAENGPAQPAPAG
jgi:hypothetical protein